MLSRSRRCRTGAVALPIRHLTQDDVDSSLLQIGWKKAVGRVLTTHGAQAPTNGERAERSVSEVREGRMGASPSQCRASRDAGRSGAVA